MKTVLCNIFESPYCVYCIYCLDCTSHMKYETKVENEVDSMGLSYHKCPSCFKHICDFVTGEQHV